MQLSIEFVAYMEKKRTHKRIKIINFSTRTKTNKWFLNPQVMVAGFT